MTDIVERLREPIIADAFEEGRITDGCLAHRLVRDRHAASDEIERLRAERDALRKQVASVNIVIEEVRGWASDAGSTKTPRGRTLNAVLRRLREALKGKQAARALLRENKDD